MLEVVADYDDKDSYARQNAWHNRRRFASAKAAFEFAVPDKLDIKGELAELFQRAVERVEALGGKSRTIDFSPFEEAARLLYEGPWIAERQLATADVPAEQMLPVTRQIIKEAPPQTAADAFAAQYRLAELKRTCDALMADVEFVLIPTTSDIYTLQQLAEQPFALNSELGRFTNFMNLLDYSATAIPAGISSVGVPWGVTLFAQSFADFHLLNYAAAIEQGELTAAQNPCDDIDVVVCGAHLAGQPLNWQLTERGGRLIDRTHSSANYHLYALPDGKRPAMVRDEAAGTAIEVEVWRLPSEAFGSFVAGIPAPLGIGKVELSDGRWLSGFIGEGYGLAGAKDISEYGGWRNWLAMAAPTK